MVTRRVPAAGAGAFAALLRELITAAAEHPGHVSAEVLQGSRALDARDYHVVYRFADTATLRAWEQSGIRRSLLDQLDQIAPDRSRTELTGLEAWFDLPADGPPRRHRMAALTWVGIWPVVSSLLWFVGPHLLALRLLARTALITVAAVLAMTYLVMPALIRFAAPWLVSAHPRVELDRSSLDQTGELDRADRRLR